MKKILGLSMVVLVMGAGYASTAPAPGANQPDDVEAILGTIELVR